MPPKSGNFFNQKEYRMRTKLAVAALVLAVLISTAAQAEVKLPSILSDNMVVQQGKKVAFWGTAAPGEMVTVTFPSPTGSAMSDDGRKPTASATADKDGQWKVEIKPPAAGGPYEVTIAGSNTITLKNVLVGEVWLCAGQSNMQFSLDRAVGGREEEVRAQFYPEIRQFALPRTNAKEPQADCRGSWAVCTSETAGRFTAVGYFFGMAIYKELKVPVGLINNAVGGTPIEDWLDRRVLEGDSELKPDADRFQSKMTDYEKAKKDFQAAQANWSAISATSVASGQKAPVAPRAPDELGSLYNGEVAPLLNFPIGGALWYQGESNSGNKRYGRLLTDLIESYRQAWGVGDFPFLVVQLTSFGKVTNDPNESGGWMTIREAELKATSLPKVGMAVTIDVGDAGNIHPLKKKEVGERLAKAALAIAYDKKLVFSGPIFQSSTVDGNKVRLKFKFADSGLVAQGDTLKGFAVAGADKKFFWADAKIDGPDVVVQGDQVAAPVAVRYGWAQVSDCNLYNKEGLPASPFRTDDW
jgi:sialate O-acetylesterase